MKAISLKAGRWLQLLQILQGVKSANSLNRVAVATIGATVCFLASIAGYDPAMYAAAFATLAVIRPLAGKGGDK